MVSKFWTRSPTSTWCGTSWWGWWSTSGRSQPGASLPGQNRHVPRLLAVGVKTPFIGPARGAPSPEQTQGEVSIADKNSLPKGRPRRLGGVRRAARPLCVISGSLDQLCALRAARCVSSSTHCAVVSPSASPLCGPQCLQPCIGKHVCA